MTSNKQREKNKNERKEKSSENKTHYVHSLTVEPEYDKAITTSQDMELSNDHMSAGS